MHDLSHTTTPYYLPSSSTLEEDYEQTSMHQINRTVNRCHSLDSPDTEVVSHGSKYTSIVATTGVYGS